MKADWFDVPGGTDALDVLARIPLDQWGWLGGGVGLAAVSTLLRRAARRRARRAAERDVDRALPRVAAAARAAGFRGYAVEWSLAANAVVLTLWDDARGGFAAVGNGRARAQAVLAALAAILAALPPEPVTAAQARAGATSDRSEPSGADSFGNGPGESGGAGPGPETGPAPDWWRTELGLAPGASRSDADRAWRALAKEAHPDRGGSVERMARLNAARDEARRILGQGGLRSGTV